MSALKERPYVICLMMSSVDGKILSDSWGSSSAVKALTSKFEQIHAEIGIKAWICGRSTMEKDFTNGIPPIHKTGDDIISREDFIVDNSKGNYAIVLDRQGKLGWNTPVINGDQVITILSEKVEDSYLRHLREIGLSYIFAGKSNIDLSLALNKLYRIFGIKKLMLEGGGRINGSFIEKMLIDEFYHLLLPLIDGKEKTSTIFESKNSLRNNKSTLLLLEEIVKLEDDVLWLKYKVKRNTH